MKPNLLTSTILLIFFFSIMSCKNESKKTSETNGSFFKLSLAQWSFHKAFRENGVSPYEFAKMANELGFEGLEYVSQLYPDVMESNDKVSAIQNFIEKNNVVQIGIFCSTLSSIFLFLKNFEIKKFVVFLDYFSILILNYYLSPLIAFTVYFCFLHSIRHSISLAIDLDPNSLVSGFRLFIKKALPLTILTAIFSFIAPVSYTHLTLPTKA